MGRKLNAEEYILYVEELEGTEYKPLITIPRQVLQTIFRKEKNIKEWLKNYIKPMDNYENCKELFV